MGKSRKIITGILVVALAGTGIGAGLMQMKKNSVKTVNVTPVSGLLQQYYSSNTTIDGTVTASATQTVSGDKDLIVDQVYVAKGDAVKKGDPLISFDTTLVEMELNIAKLKKQKQEQDLNKAQARLKSLQNGGPVEESDGGANADSSDVPGSSAADSGDDLTPDRTLSSAADMNGNYLAVAFRPLLLNAFTDGGEVDGETEAVEEIENGQSEETNTKEDTEQSINDTPAYGDPSASDFGDGTENSFDDSSQLTPTPTPTIDQNMTDGEEPFYQKLDGKTIPYTGTGTEEDPYIFLCSSAKEKVTVTGGFFNKMAGYSEDGTQIEHQGGYWYQLEFHQSDKIRNYEDRKESCTGYYLINGSLLEKPVYEFAEVEFTLADASRYENDDADNDGSGGEDSTKPAGTTVSRADAIKYQNSKIASLKLDIQESDIKISQLEKKANKKLVSSKLDGTVSYVGDVSSGTTTDGKALLKVKSADGYYVVGAVSELMLDTVKEGTKLSCTSYTSGQFEAEIMDVSEYPVDSYNYYGDNNPNVSYYAFTAVVDDKSLQFDTPDYVMVEFQNSAVDNGSMVLSKAFVKSENGKNYVYKDDNGILKKQEIRVGAIVDGGYDIIIKGGISIDDKLAFPYGKDAVEGAKTNEVTLDYMYNQ
ncbi:efflux RND transporter periplasmic adaptor subunit [Blautia difficilis]|uniref:Efflux RND transporter periplasmic adaptor subunit n=1 Tax=Blautia difficilis TaxID=2763027 RepID=A0ABR7IIX8_9FIRM|nr:efflux RND transporter periplasmic adaptor subunit [Blautia difficilis]MBC5779977.1 efflux RND transporter periplasmic adaptor subunit [Blautia difficilis]